MPWRIRRLDGGREQVVEGAVVVEEPLEIRINERSVAVLMRTPGMEKELAAGFCLGEGLVRDLWDIGLIRHCGRVAPGESAEGDRAAPCGAAEAWMGTVRPATIAAAAGRARWAGVMR